jgi:hypothetical protein
VLNSSALVLAGQVWVLPVNFFRTPTVGDVIQDDLNHLDIGVIDPSTAVAVDHDVREEFKRRIHGFDSHLRAMDARTEMVGTISRVGTIRLGRPWFSFNGEAKRKRKI